MSGLLEKFARAFPFWIAVTSALALVVPEAFSWFITGEVLLGARKVTLKEGGLVTPALSVIMLSMGLTLKVEDLRAVVHQKRTVLLGVVLQFTVMPGLGFLLARVFGLSAPLAAGLILVCCCPGGTASNVIAYLAKADVPLSVAMTACSTLLAAVLTPTLTTLLLGQRVSVDVPTLYLTTAEVVLFPVALGVLLRRYADKTVARMLVILPALAVVCIVLIVSGIIAVQRELIVAHGLWVLLAVVVTHGLAFWSSYVIARFRGASLVEARTISIEVGMQNSGLGVVLARASFVDPMVAVTPALSAVVHCLYGSVVAAVWGRADPAQEKSS